MKVLGINELCPLNYRYNYEFIDAASLVQKMNILAPKFAKKKLLAHLQPKPELLAKIRLKFVE